MRFAQDGQLAPLSISMLVAVMACACAVGTSSGDERDAAANRGDAAIDSASDAPPSAGDGGACGTRVGPNVTASCSACGTTHVCQPNGCYNGYWCDTSVSKCGPPPTACP